MAGTGALAVAAGCLGSGGDGDGGGQPKADGGTERVLSLAPITAGPDGTDVRYPRNVHLENAHDQPHTVAVTLTQESETRFESEFDLAPHDEVELENLIHREGTYRFTARTGDQEGTTEVVVGDPDRGDVDVTVLTSGTLAVRQNVCENCKGH